MATIKDVAKLAGVSVTTVSRAFNNTAPVNEKTKERIMQAIEELNYTPSIIAQGMRTKKSKTIGVIIPDYLNPFYHVLFKYVENEARQEGYHVIISSTGEDTTDEDNYINDLVNRNVDGIIVCSYKGQQETIEKLIKISKKIPVVFLDNLQAKRQTNAIYVDGYTGIKRITEHLIQLGHREIAFIKSLERYNVANDRYQGYLDAMKKAGLNVKKELVYEGNYHIESGCQAAKYFLENKRISLTAIVSSTDLMALGVMNYLKSQGYQIPQDIAVAGFDDIYMSKLTTPPLTTYKQPIKDIAKKAVKLILHQLNHPKTEKKQIKLEGELVIRRSTDITKSETEIIGDEIS